MIKEVQKVIAIGIQKIESTHMAGEDGGREPVRSARRGIEEESIEGKAGNPRRPHSGAHLSSLAGKCD